MKLLEKKNSTLRSECSKGSMVAAWSPPPETPSNLKDLLGKARVVEDSSALQDSLCWGRDTAHLSEVACLDAMSLGVFVLCSAWIVFEIALCTSVCERECGFGWACKHHCPSPMHKKGVQKCTNWSASTQTLKIRKVSTQNDSISGSNTQNDSIFG